MKDLHKTAVNFLKLFSMIAYLYLK